MHQGGLQDRILLLTEDLQFNSSMNIGIHLGIANKSKRFRWWLENYKFNPFTTIYYNFKLLPFKQAIHLPILFDDVRFHKSSAEWIIDSDNIHFGMIRIGILYNCHYWINKKTHLEMRKGGRIVFHGTCSIAKGAHIELEPNGLIEIENKVNINAGLNLYSFYKVRIGKGCRIGFETTIMDSDFHPMYDILGDRLTKTYAPVEIGENCWIGMKTIIKKGTKIHPNNIIASASVVSGLFRKGNCIIQGNPAKIVAEGYRITPESFYTIPFAQKKAYK